MQRGLCPTNAEPSEAPGAQESHSPELSAMKWGPLLVVATIASGAGCSADDGNPSVIDSVPANSNDARAVSAAQGPRIVFHVSPLVATAERARTRIDTVWSQNDDRDAIEVELIGGAGASFVDVEVDLEIEPTFEGDEPPTPTPKAARFVRWKELKRVHLDSLPRAGSGYRLLLLRPSAVMADKVISKDVSEAVGGIRVSIMLSDGRTASATLSFLPAI